MRKISTWVLTAAMTAGVGAVSLVGVSLGADSADVAAARAAERSDVNLTLPAGFQEKDVDAVSGVKTGLEKLTARFAAKGDFNKMLAELATQDKDRARDFKGVDQTKLDGRIEQISQAWKAKYGQDFDPNDKNVIFDDRYMMVQGEVTDPSVALAGWPIAATNEAMTAGSKQTPADASDKAVKDETSAAKMDKGRNVALVRFPASHALPAITASMIHELPAFYRVDIPNDRTGEQIYNDTLTHLTYIGEHVDQWPADVNDAYRMVAHHAIAAVYGVDITKEAANAH